MTPDKRLLVSILQNVIRGKAALLPELLIAHERPDGITVHYRGNAYVIVVHETPFVE
ncbi:MAG: hypothetical protein UY48_C0033G0010 [Candidatus Gottesmanbacteria bacterium GW2011_GWB1_49_7]|uniref:Uncharacterized protein n=1 Tax=Candidatus Gottesmanbacteria bacterium GW2011_GWB1_49_7 TaxID=1618448 RepID=A0A0G1Y6Z8_9BACT|nr:MAG: hypothetical protein UY48_C0033G0010 [Candidatus Gottesmanbacteria bacterium GW2011_GWB1_49_7]